MDSMQFYADLLGEILGESAPSSKNLHMRQSAIKWPKTIVTDARDVYDKVSTEKGGLPQQKARTQEIATIGEWLVTSGAEIRWTADEKMIMNGLTKDLEYTTRYCVHTRRMGVWAETCTKDRSFACESYEDLMTCLEPRSLCRTRPF